MKLIEQALRILLPQALVDTNDPQTAAHIDATADAIERFRKYLEDVQTESNPATASTTLTMWYEALGLPYNPSEPLETRQVRIATIYTSVGGQNPDYLRRQLQHAFPSVDFEEKTGDAPDEWKYYTLTGSLDTEEQRRDLFTLVQKLFPAHLHYIDLVEIGDTFNWSACGIGRVGAARCGVFADDYLVAYNRVTEAGDTRVTEAGDDRIVVLLNEE
jgi:hypothetical protein